MGVWLWFVGALTAFHLALVWPRLRLRRRGWRVVDYIWLGSTALTLISLTGQARQLVAPWQAESAEFRVEGAMNLVRNTVSMYTSPASCGQIQPGLLSDAERFEEQRKIGQIC